MDGGHAPMPAHRALRERTRDAHEATEATEGMRRLMDGRMDEAGYRQLLAAQLGLFTHWERARAGWLDRIQPRWAYTSRLAPLATDVGDAPTPGPLGAAAWTTDVPSGDDEAGYWGELYVIEGSPQ